MKTLVIITTALFITSCALAETKKELIEKVMELCNAEQDFLEGTSQVLGSLQQELDGEHTNRLINQAREYIRNNSLRPIYASALDVTYTEDELKQLIRYYESIDAEFEPLLRKQAADFRIAYSLGKAEWTENLLKELESALPAKPESRTTADVWNSYTSKEKQIYIRGVMDGSSYTYYNFYYHSKDSVNEATLKPIILNVHSDIAITFSYLELISVMDELQRRGVRSQYSTLTGVRRFD